MSWAQLLRVHALIAVSFAAIGCNGETPEPEPEPEPEPLPLLVINEVQAKNESTFRVDGIAPDWIELFNADSVEIDLARVTVEDDGGTPHPVGEGTLAPGAFLLLHADPLLTQLPFALSSDVDKVTVRIDQTIVDSYKIENAGEDASFARFPDGGDWAVTARPSPGATNGAGPTETEDPRDVLFNANSVWRIDLTITEAAYRTLNQSVWGDRETVPAVFEMDGVELPEVGLRLKGSASADSMNGKPAFKLDFNEFIPGTRWRRLKGMNLHNGNVWDPTRSRDHFTYTLARAVGLPAPRVGWADVWINDQPYGLYILQEDHDDVLLDVHWPGQGELSLLVEPNKVGFDFAGWGSNLSQLPGAVQEAPDPMDPALQQTIVSIVQLLRDPPTDENITALYDLVDADNLHAYTAWEGMVGHMDGYMANNNWRFAVIGSDKKLRLVPTGAEWTWEQDPMYPQSGALMDYCTRNPGCRQQVAQKLLDMADLIEDLQFESEFERISAMLNPLMVADPRSPHGPNQVKNTRQTTLRHIRDNPARARALVQATHPELLP